MNRSIVFAGAVFSVALGAALWLIYPEDENRISSVPLMLIPVESGVSKSPVSQAPQEVTQTQSESSAWIDEWLRSHPKIQTRIPSIQSYQTPAELSTFEAHGDREAKIDPDVREKILAALRKSVSEATDFRSTFQIVADAMKIDMKPEEFGAELLQKLTAMGQKKAHQMVRDSQASLARGCIADASWDLAPMEYLVSYLRILEPPEYWDLLPLVQAANAGHGYGEIPDETWRVEGADRRLHLECRMG